jgi:hypothetical protein
MAPAERARLRIALASVTLAAVACAGPAQRLRTTTRGAVTTTVSTPSAPVATAAIRPGAPCDGRAPPPRYDHVVMVVFENRTWARVGGPGFGPQLPYLRSLAGSCAWFDDWSETDPAQSSLTQYVGLVSGVDNPATVDDCAPQGRCTSTDDNLFREVRTTGGSARTYVEGAEQPCSAAGNAPKHVPALYFTGTYQDGSGSHDDHAFCAVEVRPGAELDPDALPTFAMVVPDLCDDGHDCANDVVDDWARSHVGAILAGADYRRGTTAVVLVWDEDRPVPNLLIAPAAVPGPISSGASHADLLVTVEEMLGLPIMAQGQLVTAVSLRPRAHL